LKGDQCPESTNLDFWATKFRKSTMACQTLCNSCADNDWPKPLDPHRRVCYFTE